MKKILTVFVVITTFLVAAHAHAAVYYFNNAVNTDPTELGNYWNDEDFTDPATVLPDNTVDEITIGDESTYDGDAIFIGDATNGGVVSGNAIFNDQSLNDGTVSGNAIFNDQSLNRGTIGGNATFNSTYYNTTAPIGGNFIFSSNKKWRGSVAGTVYGSDNQPITTYVFNDTSQNEGAITGNAVFNGDTTENNGSISGTKTRYYTSDSTITRDFIGWRVVADAAVIDVSGTTVDDTTVFVTTNGGSFEYGEDATFLYGSFINSTIKLAYSLGLSSSTLPSGTDYTVKVNGNTVSVNSVSISSKKVLLTLAAPVLISDDVTINYTPGLNPLKDKWSRTIPSQDIANRSITAAVSVADTPNFLASINSKIYVSKINSGVSVISTATNAVDTISGLGSGYFASVGNSLYVTSTSEGSVSVIDTNSDTVVATIPVGSGPYFSAAANNKLYVANQLSDTVSVIDTSSNTVSTTLDVGTSPNYIIPVGTMLYLTSNGSNDLQVIDTTTDTIVDSISLATHSGIGILVGERLYINGTDRMYVIDTTTNSVVSTISLTQGLGWITRVGTKLYISNQSDSTLVVVDTLTNTASNVISVGQGPYFNVIFGRMLYVINQQDVTVTVIDTATDTIVDTIPVGITPYYSTFFEDKLYIGNNASLDVSILNTPTIPSQLPNLTSFSTSASSGTYSPGQSIPITAHFGRTLHAGSAMTVLLNTGRSVTLSSVSGPTLSGTYTIQAGDHTPDLAVRSITSAAVSDTNSHTRTSYDLPSSVGSFVAENSFITRNLGDTKSIKIGNYQTFDTGNNPYQVAAKDGFLYTANQGAGTVSVINQSTGTLVSTIDVGDEPYGVAVAGSELYVANTGSDTVSVIDTSTNAVTHTISVGVKPYYVATIGSNIYVTNSLSNTVSVINATTHSVTDTIPVGAYPRGIKAHGTDLYVANYGDPNYPGGNSISVIDSDTNTVADTISTPVGSDGPRGVAVIGDKVYVTNFRSNNVSVIDTNTNTVTDTIDVGMGPRGILGSGTTLYVENFDDGTISVIDTDTNTVTDTVDVGHSPSGLALSGTTLYITSFQDNRVYALDTTTNELIAASAAPEEVPSTSPGPSGGSGLTLQQSMLLRAPTDCVAGYKFSPSTGRACPHSSTLPPTTSPIFSPFTRTLRLGMIGEDVKALQIYLNTHGFPLASTGPGSRGNETQKFGSLTKNAVLKFQKAHKLKTDGVVGRRTITVFQ